MSPSPGLIKNLLSDPSPERNKFSQPSKCLEQQTSFEIQMSRYIQGTFARNTSIHSSVESEQKKMTEKKRKKNKLVILVEMLINGVSNYYNMFRSYKISNGSQASCKVFNIRREASDRSGRRTNANV